MTAEPLADPFLVAMDRSFWAANPLEADVPAPAEEADEVRLDVLERDAFEGRSWRVKPYPGPLDLLLALERNYVETAALRTISEELTAMRDRLQAGGPADHPEAITISLGPQEGKSSLVVFAFAIWLLLDDPDRRVMVVSYEKEIATRWGRAIRGAIESSDGEDGRINLHLRVRQDSRAADRFDLVGHRGGVYCVGISGAITGRPGDVVIVDDPFRDKQQARSLGYRTQIQDQWRTAINPRLQPGSLVVVSHTRWHEKDLIGWLHSEFGDMWRKLNIPAQSEGAGDPLERRKGTWLTSARGRTDAQWTNVRRVAGEYDFAALYQGKPSPAEGGLFKRRTFRYWGPVPSSVPPTMPINGTPLTDTTSIDRWRVQLPGRPLPTDLNYAFRFVTVDLAASTKTSADWSVALAWAIPPDGSLVCLDLWRGQVDPEEHWSHIGTMAARWQCGVYVENSQHGTSLTYEAGRAGIPLQGLDADTDKYTRAVPAARLFGLGTVYLPARAHWLAELESELAEFPHAGHDDQVDAVAYAARVRGAYWTPDTPPQGAERNSARDPAMEAIRRATADADRLDYTRQAW